MSSTARSIEAGESEVGLLGAVRRHSWLVAASTAVFAAAGYGLATLVPREYAATATVTVARPDTQPVYRTVSAGDASNRQLTMANQLHDSRTLARAAAAMGTSAVTLANRLTITPQAQTSLIDVMATASSPAAAAATANAVVRAYEAIAADDEALHTAASVAPLQASSTQLGTQIARLRVQVQARGDAVRTAVAAEFARASTPPVAGAEDRSVQAALQFDPAYTALRASLADQQVQQDALTEKIRQLRVDGSLLGVPFSHVDAAAEPTSPDTLAPSRGAVLGGIVGLLVGCGLAWRRAERRRPMSAVRAGAILGAPVLLDMALPRRSLSQLSRLSGFALADRRLGSVAFSLARFCDARGLRRLVVAPATVEKEGPAVALAVAVAIHRAGDEVVLVDVGDDGGRLTTLSGLREEIGFRDVIAGRVSLESAVVSLGVAETSIRFVPLGTGAEAPAVAVATRLALMPGESLTLVDAPGLEISGQAIGAAADQAALVLVTSEASAAEALAAARTKLELAGTVVVGLVHVRATGRRRRIGRASAVETVSVVRQDPSSTPAEVRLPRVAEPQRPAR